MTLELDTRQRAMLQEMGVHVWLPKSGVAILEQATVPQPLATPPARAPGAWVAAAAPLEELLTRKPGVPTVAATPPASPAPAAPVPHGAQRVPASTPTAGTGAGDAHALALPAVFMDWTALADTVRSCQACSLCAGRSHTTLVPPPANRAQCDWMVVGDAPDEDEDRAGAPFAGQDGVLLANMLRALGLQQANAAPAAGGAGDTGTSAARSAYVTNVLKCRPAHGAVPQAAELAQCAAYLQREIALVKPKMILAMGRFANQVLLGESPALAALPLGKLRGTVHRFQGTPVVVTYHPKLLMRNSADKAKAWADLCLAAATLET